MIEAVMQILTFFMIFFILSALAGIIPIILLRMLIKDRFDGRKWFNFIYIAFIIAGISSIIIMMTSLYYMLIIDAMTMMIAYFIYKGIIWKSRR